MKFRLKLIIKSKRWLAAAGYRRDGILIPLAVIVGVLGGLVGVGFDWLVHHSEELFFGHIFRQVHAWRIPYGSYLLLILLPASGGLLVGLIQQFIARTGPSHGIPEVIEALKRREGRLPLRRGIFKSITASLTIGSGGSAGVEAPIVEIGSVLGSVLGRVLHVGREHTRTLVGCGAAAGLAAIFNAPLAGVLFVLEVVLRDFSVRTFIPVVIASVFGTSVAQAVLGDEAIFSLPPVMHTYTFSFAETVPYLVLGLLCGLLGVAFTYSERFTHWLWGRLRVPGFVKPALGGGALGVLGVVFALSMGSAPAHGVQIPSFYSGGYQAVESLLDPNTYQQTAPEAVEQSGAAAVVNLASAGEIDHLPADAQQEHWAASPVSATLSLLLALVVFKLVGTCLTVGSGGSGGVIAPSLFLGAGLGGAFAVGLQSLGILPGFNPASYAVAGMAGVLAAVVQCPLTAFLLVIEVTHDYAVVVPVMLVAILATSLAHLLARESIYSHWLKLAGIHNNPAANMSLLRRSSVRQINLDRPVVVFPSEASARLLELAQDHTAPDYVVCDQNHCYLGMVVGADISTALVQREALPLMIVAEMFRQDLPVVAPDEQLDSVLEKFNRFDVSTLTVVDQARHVCGVLSRSRLLHHYQRLLDGKR